MTFTPNVGEIFTATLTSAFTLPAGAITVDFKNTGGADATIKGNATKGTPAVASTPVTIAASEAYSIGNTGKTQPAIVIDATGTTLEIVATY